MKQGLSTKGNIMDINDHIINVVAAFIAVEYIDHGFDKKYHGWKRWLLFCGGYIVYFCVLTGLNSLISFEGLLSVFYSGVLIIYGVFALQGSFYDKVFLGFLWNLIALLGTFFVYGVMGFITEESLQELLNVKGAVYLLAAAAASIAKFIMGRIVLGFYRRMPEPHRKEHWMIAGALLILLLTGLGMFELELGTLAGKAKYGLLTLLLVGEFLGVLILEKIYHRMGEYQKEKLESEFREQQEKAKRENIIDLYRIGREVNHWRHDMNGKLDVILRLQKKGHYEEAENNIEKLCQGLKQYPDLPQETGNEGLNAALMKAIPRCLDEGIKFSYVVIGKPERIDIMDMGSLMGNLFDNAIEACLRLKDGRILDVVIREEKEKTEIRIENSVAESILQHNSELMSSKANAELHGFGMETIDMIVQRYHGEYIYWEEDGHFIQEICLLHGPLLHDQ